jgi:hypothetical protein
MPNHALLLRKYFQLLQWFTESEAAFLDVLHPEFMQVDYPNLIVATTRERNFRKLMEGVAAGRRMLANQHFHHRSLFETGDTVFAEYYWTGELKVKAGRLHRGHILKANICSIIQLKSGKIFRQSNYNCFEPLR